MPGSPVELAEAFASLVGQGVDEERIDLLRAALTIARTEYPNLDIESYVSRVEALAERVSRRTRDVGDTAHAIYALNTVLFQEEGLRGNRDDYYDPRNSFLNDVLDRRLGIPITLALVYMEVARRVGFPLFGVGMPGHFLLKHYDAAGHSILIDVFERGVVVTEEDCRQKLNTIYSGQLALQPEFLLPVTRRQMLTRML